MHSIDILNTIRGCNVFIYWLTDSFVIYFIRGIYVSVMSDFGLYGLYISWKQHVPVLTCIDLIKKSLKMINLLICLMKQRQTGT